jgi:hypothetical protein
MYGLKLHITTSGIKLYKSLELEYSNVTGSTILQAMIRYSSGLRHSTKNIDFYGFHLTEYILICTVTAKSSAR